MQLLMMMYAHKSSLDVHVPVHVKNLNLPIIKKEDEIAGHVKVRRTYLHISRGQF